MSTSTQGGTYWPVSNKSSQGAGSLGLCSAPAPAAVSAELERKIRSVIDKYWEGKLYMKIPHPAFDHWPATYGYERWEIIKPHLDPAGGTALDIGAHFGSFSHLLENLGFQVTAVEVAREHAEIMQEIRDMAGKKFHVLCQSIFDFREAKFDLVFALNVFHHFLKRRDSFESLISFLNRLTSKTIIFQGHDPNEPQMNGAYQNFHPDEFCEFVREHSGLANAVCIGNSGVRKIYKISSSN